VQQPTTETEQSTSVEAQKPRKDEKSNSGNQQDYRVISLLPNQYSRNVH